MLAKFTTNHTVAKGIDAESSGIRILTVYVSTKMVIEHVKKKYGYRYAARSMYDLLHRIGFSIKRPRITHYKSATESEMQFKKKQEGQSKDTQNKDMRHSVWMRQRT